eukprot:536377-Pelagomonas_calceolata.AAC.5
MAASYVRVPGAGLYNIPCNLQIPNPGVGIPPDSLNKMQPRSSTKSSQAAHACFPSLSPPSPRDYIEME